MEGVVVVVVVVDEGETLLGFGEFERCGGGIRAFGESVVEIRVLILGISRRESIESTEGSNFASLGWLVASCSGCCFSESGSESESGSGSEREEVECRGDRGAWE